MSVTGRPSFRAPAEPLKLTQRSIYHSFHAPYASYHTSARFVSANRLEPPASSPRGVVRCTASCPFVAPPRWSTSHGPQLARCRLCQSLLPFISQQILCHSASFRPQPDRCDHQEGEAGGEVGPRLFVRCAHDREASATAGHGERERGDLGGSERFRAARLPRRRRRSRRQHGADRSDRSRQPFERGKPAHVSDAEAGERHVGQRGPAAVSAPSRQRARSATRPARPGDCRRRSATPPMSRRAA